MMSAGKTVKYIGRLVVSFLLIAYLSYKSNWNTIYYAVKNADVIFLCISVLLLLGSSFLLVLKYYVLIRDTHIHHSVWSLIKINTISGFYSLFIPMGQGIARWYKITSNKRGRSFFLACSIFERLFYVLAILLAVLFSSIILNANSDVMHINTLIRLPVLMLIVVFVLGILFFQFPDVQSIFVFFINKFFVVGEKWRSVINFFDNFKIKGKTLELSSYVLILSVCAHILFVVRMIFLYKSLSIDLSYIDIAWMSSIALFIQAIPISIAGIGVRESSYAYLFSLYHLPLEKGVSVGFLFMFQNLMFAAAGGVLSLISQED